jgi:hypothetical protein
MDGSQTENLFCPLAQQHLHHAGGARSSGLAARITDEKFGWRSAISRRVLLAQVHAEPLAHAAAGPARLRADHFVDRL